MQLTMAVPESPVVVTITDADTCAVCGDPATGAVPLYRTGGGMVIRYCADHEQTNAIIDGKAPTISGEDVAKAWADVRRRLDRKVNRNR